MFTVNYFWILNKGHFRWIMVSFVPASLLSSANVPLDNGDYGVVDGHPPIYYAVVFASVCLCTYSV